MHWLLFFIFDIDILKLYIYKKHLIDIFLVKTLEKKKPKFNAREMQFSLTSILQIYDIE
jgi:hypothetical protein